MATRVKNLICLAISIAIATVYVVYRLVVVGFLETIEEGALELTFVFLILICNTAVLVLTYIDSKKTSKEHKEYLERTDKRHEVLINSLEERTDKLITEMRKDRKRRYR